MSSILKLKGNIYYNLFLGVGEKKKSDLRLQPDRLQIPKIVNS